MFPSHERSKTKYIGRKKELTMLSHILEEIVKGKGKVVIVGGEAGIGKTRLIEQMRELPSFKDFKFLSGRCLYFKDTDIYLPFKEMFSQYRQLIKDTEEEMASPFSVQKGDRET
ncbi:MAG: AAA family ATPase, partial [Thermoplasmatota archaeon]